jgi:hypothetical protein
MEESEIGEVGVDRVNEEAHEKAKEHEHRAPWLRWLALSTALFAVVAAVASLKAGHFANEALLKQGEATDQWSYYQAKGNKSVTREAEAEILVAMGKPEAAEATEKARAEAERYRKDQDKILEDAKGLEAEARGNLERHEHFAYIVTTLQVSIGLSAVAALIERRWIWLMALVAGLGGIAMFVLGLAA